MIVLFFYLAESEPNEDDLEDNDCMKKEGNVSIKQEKGAFASSSDKKDGQNALKIEKDPKESQRAKETKVSESEMVRDLKTQLK